MGLARLPRNLCAFLIVICLLSLPALAHTDVTVGQAKDLIDSTENLVVVDVREPYEYCDARGHLPGAMNFPWNSGVLQARYEELPLESPILVVCRSGGRSNAAANFLDSKGFSTVYDMLGGMSAWAWETSACKYSGGRGTADDPYQIATAADLIALGETPDDYDKHFILTADVDLDPNLPGRQVFDAAVIAPYIQGRTGLVGTPFTGIFDGNGHTISHMTITGDYYLGLFGQVAVDAELKNLGVMDVNIIGARFIGGLAGSNSGAVTQSNSTGVVSGSQVGGLVGVSYGSITTSSSTAAVSGAHVLGSLVGRNNGGNITTSYSTGDVSGDENLGGLVGINEGGKITKSYSTGTVVGDDAAVGGLVGQNVSGSVLGCYSIGDVGGHEWIGGLVGWNNIEGSISDCYSAGDVNGSWEIGGLVGENSGIITMSYSTSVVSGHTRVGGLVGSNSCVQNACGEITDSDWDIETSGELNMCGLQDEGASGCDPNCGKTTAEMQTTAAFLDAGWDFVGETENGPNDVWKMWDGYDYPRLAWEPGPNTPLVFVDINDPGFCGQMSKYEVTNAQYCDFLNAALTSGDITVDGNDVYGANGSNSGTDYAGQLYYKGGGSGYTGYGATNGGAARVHYSAGAFSVDSGFGNHPVSYVSWYGAVAFANYYGYYLPTDDQWQAVADYDGTYIYGCGETIDPGIANYRHSQHPDGTTSVGSFGRYGYGMSDMAGNVWEWTSSSLDSNRIFRGGSLGSIDSDCDVSIRGDGIPHVAYWDVGFRVCR